MRLMAGRTRGIGALQVIVLRLSVWAQFCEFGVSLVVRRPFAGLIPMRNVGVAIKYIVSSHRPDDLSTQRRMSVLDFNTTFILFT